MKITRTPSIAGTRPPVKAWSTGVDEERAALGDKLADAAMRYQRRAHEFAEMARKVRPPGWNPPHAPR